MRLQRFNYELTKAIEYWLETKDNKRIKKLIKPMQKTYLKWVKEENDYSTGEESYGYDDPEAVMDYISDRWQCAFRLRWIIDGIENGKI